MVPGPVHLPRVALPGALLAALLVGLVAACTPRTGDRTAEPAAVASASARLSAGCAEAAGPVPDRVTVGGRTRSLLVRMPADTSAAPHDLVIAFHGRTNDAARARRYFGLDDALPEAVVVHPRALPAGPGSFAWSDPGDPPDRLRDFALVEAIVDAFGRAACIDLERVFVVGHSLGASFANDVACRLGGTIRAVASVAGGIQGGACAGPVAALVLHHPDDRLVPLAVGERVRDTFLAAGGHAGDAGEPVTDPALAALGCERHGAGDATHPVVWCLHGDATGPGGRHDPHTWPRGTASAIRSFFASLP